MTLHTIGSRPEPTDFGLRLAAACCCAAARHHRQRRHVVFRRGLADGSGGFCRHPRRCIGALHSGDGRFRLRQCRAGTAGRPLRHPGADPSRDCRARRRLCRFRLRPQSLGVCDRACVCGVWRIGDIRAADRRHLALVRASARDCGRDRGIGQLSRRHGLAADHTALYVQRRLAADAYRHRTFLCRCDAAAFADVPSPRGHAAGDVARSQWRRDAGRSWNLAATH